MKREDYHKALDELLDHVGFEDNTEVKWGSVSVEVKYEAGKEVIRITERETSKPIKG